MHAFLSGSQTMGTPMQWAGMGATQLQQWPKAELDSMHASNEYGALWNDINRTNLTGQQMAYGQGSGAGALAGAGLGAVSNMVKFAPIQPCRTSPKRRKSLRIFSAASIGNA